MSISSEISRLSGNVSSAFGAVSQIGGTVPSGANSDDLAASIRSIPQSGGGSGLPAVDSTDNGKVLTVVNGAWDKAERSRDVFWVDCVLNMQTMQFTNISHTYSEILAAAQNGVPVKTRIHSNTTDYIAIGNLIGYPDVDSQASSLEFDLFMLINLGSGNIVCYGRVLLNSFEAITLELYDTGSTRIM